MTNKSWRIRSCLAIFNTLGVFIVLAGCRQCADSPPATHLSHGRPSCGNGWCAECGPCSGFHPTVWQSWQEGAMAARCSEGEPARPAGSELFPELVPTPAAQGSGKPATPDLPVPSRSEAPRGKRRKTSDRRSRRQTSSRFRPAGARSRPGKAGRQTSGSCSAVDARSFHGTDHRGARGDSVQLGPREPGGAVRSDSHLFLHPQPTAAGIFCGFRPAAQRQRPGPGEPVAEVTPYSGSSGFRCERRKTLAGVPPLGGFVAEIPPKGGTPRDRPSSLHLNRKSRNFFCYTLAEVNHETHEKGKDLRIVACSFLVVFSRVFRAFRVLSLMPIVHCHADWPPLFKIGP